jgi:hypothetical protein
MPELAIPDERFVRIGLRLLSREDRETLLDGLEDRTLWDAPSDATRDFIETLALFVLPKTAVAMVVTIVPIAALNELNGPIILALPLLVACMWIPSFTLVLGAARHLVRAPHEMTRYPDPSINPMDCLGTCLSRGRVCVRRLLETLSALTVRSCRDQDRPTEG